MSKPYTTRDVAKLLGISRGSAILRIDRGLIEAYRDPLFTRYSILKTAMGSICPWLFFYPNAAV